MNGGRGLSLPSPPQCRPFLHHTGKCESHGCPMGFASENFLGKLRCWCFTARKCGVHHMRQQSPVQGDSRGQWGCTVTSSPSCPSCPALPLALTWTTMSWLSAEFCLTEGHSHNVVFVGVLSKWAIVGSKISKGVSVGLKLYIVQFQIFFFKYWSSPVSH